MAFLWHLNYAGTPDERGALARSNDKLTAVCLVCMGMYPDLVCPACGMRVHATCSRYYNESHMRDVCNLCVDTELWKPRWVR